MKFTVSELMARSGVKFGTSGARGLATDMTDFVCHAYTTGFLQYLRGRGQFRPGMAVAVGGDFRPSTDRIMAAVFRAIADIGGVPVNCGKVPSPAVALHGLERRIPSIMVTGSHIPDDRNGIKFNKPDGEVLKDDEAGMMAEELEDSGERSGPDGWFRTKVAVPAVDRAAGEGYVRRYLAAFPGQPLAGLRLGVYQHSAVGRDVIVEILGGLGATVTALGRSDVFLPVDTEAVRPEDAAFARSAAAGGDFDALVSADGDSDRPLVSDERGEWLRGDVAGILCARFLAADSVSTPVSSNTALERTRWFRDIRRTRIGSPYVVASMLEAAAAGRERVVGYEANGGFLLQSHLDLGGRTLRALPTRDAVIVMLGVLLLARREGRTVSALAGSLPARFTASDRLKDFPVEASRELLAGFSGPEEAANRARLDALLSPLTGSPAAGIDRKDGVRVTFGGGDIVHLRPSGNAPEFRCYTESSTPERALQLCADVLKALAAQSAGKTWR